MLPIEIINIIIKYCEICENCNTVVYMYKHYGIHTFKYLYGCYCKRKLHSVPYIY